MDELLVTNDPVLLSYVEVLLADQGITAIVLDRFVNVMEGGIAPFPCRLMVSQEYWQKAAGIMHDAGLGAWVTERQG